MKKGEQLAGALIKHLPVLNKLEILWKFLKAMANPNCFFFPTCFLLPHVFLNGDYGMCFLHLPNEWNLPSERLACPTIGKENLSSKLPFVRDTLPQTNSSPLKNRPGPKRKQSSSNHPFSGAMLVSGRVVPSGICSLPSPVQPSCLPSPLHLWVVRVLRGTVSAASITTAATVRRARRQTGPWKMKNNGGAPFFFQRGT